MQVSIIGDSQATIEIAAIARELGAALARQGITILTGGMGGVMEAASQGAASQGGTVVAILPTYEHSHANPHCTVIIATGMGHARNVIIAASADVVISVGGGSGTWSETAHALKLGKPVIALKPVVTLPGVRVAESVAQAVEWAMEAAPKP
jgi:uncharacterized protein (TIGR00725 family)